jgi:hypothetical protein
MTSQSINRISGYQRRAGRREGAKRGKERSPGATALSIDNEETLAWVEHSLKHTRNQEQARLTGLLEAVQAEVAFELELLEAGRLSCGGLAQRGLGLRRR